MLDFGALDGKTGDRDRGYIMRTISAAGSNSLGAPIGEDPFK